MAWFSLWIPLVLQFVVPLLLLGWVARAGASRALTLGAAALAALYLLAIGLAGLWLVLPWWLPFAYGVLLVGASVRGWTRAGPQPVATPTRRTVRLLAGALAGLALAAVILAALIARRVPDVAVDLAFPLDGGTYLVVNGGRHVIVNAHLATLENERFRAYRGQSHGVDLVRLNGLGLRARGLLPGDPRAYVMFGDRVLAPCEGAVARAADGAPDMPPPRPDRAHMAGNYVMLDCGGIHVLLGHLQRGSVGVRPGQTVRVGEVLGLVGNSGNTGEPHLHIHAQRPGSSAEPMSGEPLPIRLDGRYLVRNARVTTARNPGAAAR